MKLITRCLLLAIALLGERNTFGAAVSESALVEALNGKPTEYFKVVKTSNSDAGIAFSVGESVLDVCVANEGSMSYQKPVNGGLCFFAALTHQDDDQKFSFVSRSGPLEEKLISIVLATLMEAKSEESKHNLRLLASLLLNRDQTLPSLKRWHGLKPGLN